jgi:predicted AAA+ superfamily ATPase
MLSAVKRNIREHLDRWRTNSPRKPLLLQGARQVGKTYSLREFARTSFPRFHYINFEEQPSFVPVFAGDLTPNRVIQDLTLLLNTPIDRQADLLILDEIQACPRALTSLKYFAEELPELAVCAAGSLLGVHLGESPFPVGKVDDLHLYPLTFDEFLMAGGNSRLQEAYAGIRQLTPISETLHAKLWQEFKHYLITGGLPEVVTVFQQNRDDLFAALQEVRAVQTRLISNYVADMAKHCGKQNAMHLERLWRNIPAQLGRDQNGSAPKFVFKDALPGIRGYERMAGAIDWLTAAGLILRLPIANSGLLPFSAYEKESLFKLFVFDVGILGALSQLPVKSVLDYDYGTYKGFYAENFAAQQFTACGRAPLACWREGTAEIEFITVVDGAVIPIEIKSGWVTQAKSLRVFADKYHPPYCVVFSGRNLGADPRLGRHYYPLYLASRFPLTPET